MGIADDDRSEKKCAGACSHWITLLHLFSLPIFSCSPRFAQKNSHIRISPLCIASIVQFTPCLSLHRGNRSSEEKNIRRWLTSKVLMLIWSVPSIFTHALWAAAGNYSYWFVREKENKSESLRSKSKETFSCTHQQNHYSSRKKNLSFDHLLNLKRDLSSTYIYIYICVCVYVYARR